MGLVQLQLGLLLSNLVLAGCALIDINEEKNKKKCLLRFHLHPLKFFSELVHLASVLVPLRVAARQGLLYLVKLLLNKRHYCAHPEFGVFTELYLNILIFRLGVFQFGSQPIDLALRFLDLG